MLLPDLLQRFRDGDRDAFMTIYDQHSADLRPLVARFFSSPFEREEALQEVWLQVHRAAAAFDPARGQLRPWLRALATNRCREILRAKGRRPAPGVALEDDDVVAHDTPETLARRERLNVAVSNHLSTLSAAEAAVFRLALLEELPHDEVARQLGISPRRAKYLKLKLLERAAASPALRAVLEELRDP